MLKKRIIDKRQKEKFMLDDDYLNGQARLCGWQATLVYLSLCRHANKGQESFPSLKLIGEELHISRPTVIKGLENLGKYNVIQTQKNRSKTGKWLNNIYILLDKSEWVKIGGEQKNQRGKNRKRTEKNGSLYNNQVNLIDTDQVNLIDTDQVNKNTKPCKQEYKNQVNLIDTKETKYKGNTYKETHNLNINAAAPPDQVKSSSEKQVLKLYALMLKPDRGVEDLFPLDRKENIFTPTPIVLSGQEKQVKPADQGQGRRINDLMQLFKKINPAINFGNKTERAALDWLVERFGEEAEAIVRKAISVQGQAYSPTITTPWELKLKFSKLLVYLKREKENAIKAEENWAIEIPERV